MVSQLSLAIVLCACALLSHASIPTVKESVHTPVRSWANIGSPPPEHILNLRVALPQSNYTALEEQLYQISSPQHASYGKFLTKAQVEALVQPRPESVTAVEDWLAGHGINSSQASQRSPAGDWIKLAVPVSLAEKMLSTKYYMWEHVDGTRLVRTTQYSLPPELHLHIEFIQPTTLFSRSQSFRATVVPDAVTTSDALLPLSRRVQQSSKSTIDPSCATKITVTCLKQIYNAVDYRTSATNGNQIAVTGYLEEFANKEDLQMFYAQQRPDALNSTFKEILINGGINPQNSSLAGPEAALDVQFAFGLTFPTPRTFYSTGGLAPFVPDANEATDSNEPYLDWFEYLFSHPDIPQTISTSYGDEEQTVPKSYAIRVCQSFAQLGVRGVSLLFGSGDAGVAGANPDTQICLTNDGRNATRFLPNFPASCPFVTTVGATQGFNPEVATTRFASGGGFSDYFERPSYADAAVADFFKQFPKETYAGLFNPNGAPIPDVSAQGDHYQIFLSGVQVGIGGASAATPTFASIISMLNDARLNRGKPPLGWLNPMLYLVGQNALTDVVEGSNPGCGTPGFNATKGWDPLTGLGTPDFKKLMKVVLEL
ncbi:tripeptidyl peptidase A [Cytidiella melzeri]|nr:tripeptidyl peptidase A [Cytidiella melzeri]